MPPVSWDDRYSDTDYVYGEEPNTFLAEHVDLLTGPVLSIAEGEGRNAVFLATRQLEVLGVDSSAVGLAKAARLAEKQRVTISTEVADLDEYTPPADTFGAVVSIFAHLPSTTRARLYPKLVRSLKAGGVFILESYSENQLGRGTGGPSDRDMLMTCAKIERELADLEPLLLREIEREVTEGKYHTGVASVVQFIGRKRD